MDQQKSKYTFFVDGIEKLLKLGAAISCIVLLLSLFVQVLNRYVFEISWPFLQFLISFCFVWMCMIGAALAVRRNQHFEVDILAKLLRGRHKHVHAIIMTVAVLLGGGVIAWGAIGLMELGLLKKNSATGIKMIYIYFSLFAAGILIIVMAVDRLLDLTASDEQEYIGSEQMQKGSS